MRLLCTLLSAVLMIVPVIADTTCRILSMSGGGSHGAFEMGAVTRLMETPSWQPWDVHLGVSAGALGVVSLLKTDYQTNMEKVKSIWSGITTGDIIEPLKSSNSFSGNNKVMGLISKTYDSLTGPPSNGVFRVGVTDLISGEFISLPLDPASPNLTYALASTSIPVVFPPSIIAWQNKIIEAVDGGLQKNEYYLTGLQYCPKGSTDYVMDLVFANYEADDYHPSSWNLWTITTRSLELIMNDFDDLYFKDVSDCSNRRNLNLEVRIHEPPYPISIGGLDFNQGSLLWLLGYNNLTTTIYHC